MKVVKKTNEEKKKESVYHFVMSILAYTYLIFLFGLYPLILRNGYTDILDVKSTAYLWVGGTLSIIALVVLIFWIVFEKSRIDKIKEVIFNLSVLDKFVLFFGFINTVSMIVMAITTTYGESAFFGEDSRSFGYEAFMFMVICYFIVSRFIEDKKYMLLILLGSGCIVFGIAILNFLDFDVLGIYSNGWHYGNFISTLGNRNSLASYGSIIMPIGMCLFCKSNTLKAKIVSAVFCILGFMAMLASESDSIFCAIVAVFIILFWISKNTWSDLRRYFMLLFMFFSCIKIIAILFEKMTGLEDNISGLPGMFAYGEYSYLGIPVAGVLLVITIICEVRKVKDSVVKKTGGIILGIIVFSILAGLACVIYMNITMTRHEVIKKFGSIGRYIYFDKYWGSDRGQNWIYSVDVFGKLSIIKKLIGTGPATFIFALRETYGGDVYSPDNQRIIDAHNEFFQYLITIGVFGIIGYFGTVFSSIFRFIKKNKNFLLLAIGVSLVGSVVQGIVNNPHIYTTPIVFGLLALGESIKKRPE